MKALGCSFNNRPLLCDSGDLTFAQTEGIVLVSDCSLLGPFCVCMLAHGGNESSTEFSEMLCGAFDFCLGAL